MESKNETIKGKKYGEFWTQKEIELVKTEYLKNENLENGRKLKKIEIYNLLKEKGLDRSYDAFLTKLRIIKASLEKELDLHEFDKHHKYSEYTETEKDILKRVIHLYVKNDDKSKKYSYIFLYKKALSLGLNRPFDGFVKKIKTYMMTY